MTDLRSCDDPDVVYWLMRGRWRTDPRGVEVMIGYRRRCDGCGAYRQPDTTDDTDEVTLFGLTGPTREIRSYRQNCAACGAAWRLPQVPNIELRSRNFFFTLSDGRGGYASYSGNTTSIITGPDVREFADHLWQALERRLNAEQESGWRR